MIDKMIVNPDILQMNNLIFFGLMGTYILLIVGFLLSILLSRRIYYLSGLIGDLIGYLVEEHLKEDESAHFKKLREKMNEVKNEQIAQSGKKVILHGSPTEGMAYLRQRLEEIKA